MAAPKTTTTPTSKQPDPTPEVGGLGGVLQWLGDKWWLILLLAGGGLIAYLILHLLGIL